ncbi:MAG: gamma-glutamyltransferase [Alphaproteobacteria bacterium]|nr:gamma-glutamyltransferase [Alphaproteobacteria bacterium]
MTTTLALPSLVRNSLLLLAATIVGTAVAADLPRKHVIVASHKLATDAGLEMLRKGGSVVDAAIAAQAVMGLVEPQSSGLGGGTFLVMWNAKAKRVETYDGREEAPASATPDMFMKDGKPMSYPEAVLGGRSVGIPGTIAVLALAHKEHGRLPWNTLFDSAMKLAENGFSVGPRMAMAIDRDQGIPMVPATAAYFRPNGKAPQVGDVIKNPDYAASLRDIAAKGADGFYKGRLADAIVSAVSNAPYSAVKFTLEDLARYKPKKRPPICGTYRTYKLCTMGPPSSALTMLQALKMMERFNVAKLEPTGAPAIHLMTEALRVAYADRGAYIADPDFIRVPTQGLLGPKYLANRSRVLSLDKIVDRAAIKPGRPAGATLILRQLANPDRARPGTAHISLIDDRGNALAMTTTVEGPFGSRLMAGGFILNNQLTDFTFEPTTDGRRTANAPQAGKRPMSSMTPTIILDSKGRLFAVVGSPGGARIIPYVTKTVRALIDWNLSTADAVALPNATGRGTPTEVEQGRTPDATAEALRTLGHDVKVTDYGIGPSGLNSIRVTKEGFDAAADPRREGTVGGD